MNLFLVIMLTWIVAGFFNASAALAAFDNFAMWISVDDLEEWNAINLPLNENNKRVLESAAILIF